MSPSTKRSHVVWCGISIGSVALVAVLSSLNFLYRPSPLGQIPSPFESSTSFLQGSITHVGMKGTIPVDEVSFLNGETSEPLAMDIIHFVLTPATGISNGAPLSAALTPGKRMFGYLYTPNAEIERQRQYIPGAPGYPWTFAERFPGQFFASDSQRADGTFITAFEEQNDVTFLPLSQVTLSGNARYIVIANDPGSVIQVKNLIWCGNSAKEGSEECDDGDSTSGDGCSSGCFVEQGFVCNDASPTVCQALCSDGYPDQNGADDIAGNADDEQCDDGNVANGDGCNNVCHIEDGFVCNGAPSQCEALLCGNGSIEFAGADTIIDTADDEQCDDGNTANGDGCNNMCQVESGFICDDEFPSTCEDLCPNGNIDASGVDGIAGNADDEQCDDANTANGDGCSNACHIEQGFICSGKPSVCMANPPVCGNSVIEAGEECDDGNTQNNDSCGNDCRLLVMPI